MRAMDDVITLRAFEDNYTYLWSFDQGRALVVDPGDAAVVLHELDRRAAPAQGCVLKDLGTSSESV